MAGGVLERFGTVLEFEFLRDSFVKLLQLLSREHVPERQHRHSVRDLDEPLDWLRANPLRRRIRRNQLGVLSFEPLQFAHEAIVFGVRYLDIVQRVVPIVVVPNLLAQGFDFLLDVRH